MLIRAYGLFWRADEIEWNPGSGNGSSFQLLGRRGAGSTLRVADFRTQTGIYILYGDYGPYYVGLTRTSMGKRLKDHLTDKHDGKWQRFSWFGFANVLQQRDASGLQQLKQLKLTTGTPNEAIADIEALLILAMGPRNTNKMSFKKAEEWKQVPWEQRQKVLAKARSI